MAIIAVPREIKDLEYRVGLTPAGVKELVKNGHTVYIETNAGAKIGFDNTQYQAAGAKIAHNIEEIYSVGEIIFKVKEPQPIEYKMLKQGQTLFSFLHLAPDLAQTQGLMNSGCNAIAFETVTANDNSLPILVPMSIVAGRICIQKAAMYLEIANGGAGILLSGVPSTERANVAVIGGGVAGYNAALMAVGAGANVTILEKSPKRLSQLEEIFGHRVNLIHSNEDNIATFVERSDVVVGAVLIPGASAPKVVTTEMIKTMRHGSVVADIAIDQGGCFQTSKPTSHSKPVYIEHGVTHYCVTNMPGAVSRTSTIALQAASLPYLLELANKGVKKCISENPHMRNGLNVANGKVTCKEVAEALSLNFVDPLQVL
jgi:alanine dehydrogenase